MIYSEQTHPFLCLDYLSPYPQLFVYSNKRFHTKMGMVSSLILILVYFTLIAVFVGEFLKGNGMVVVYSKETSDQDFYFNMTNSLFAFNLTGFNSGTIDPRIFDIKVLYWEYYGTDRTAIEMEYERCNFEKHFKDGGYDDVFKTLGVNDFYCLNTADSNFSLFYKPYEWSGSHISIYITTCVNSTDNNHFCLSQKEIDQYMKEDSFFFSFVVNNVEIDHYNRTHPLKQVKYFHTVRISYESKVDLTMYWRPIDYATDKGLIFDKVSLIRNYQLDQTLSQHYFPSANEVYQVPMTFSKIQFELYYAIIDKYKRSYPKLQTFIANISGIVQVSFYIGHFIVYSCSIGQYYSSFFNLISSNDKKKEKETNPIASTHNMTLGSNFSDGQLILCNETKDKNNTMFQSQDKNHALFFSQDKKNTMFLSQDKNNTLVPSKDKVSFFQFRPLLSKKTEKNNNKNKNTKEVLQKNYKKAKYHRISCIKSTLWFLSSVNHKQKSQITFIESFVREFISIDKMLNSLVDLNNVMNTLTNNFHYIEKNPKSNRLNKSLIPFTRLNIHQKLMGSGTMKNKEIVTNKKYVAKKTLSGKNPKTNKSTSIGCKVGNN